MTTGAGRQGFEIATSSSGKLPPSHEAMEGRQGEARACFFIDSAQTAAAARLILAGQSFFFFDFGSGFDSSDSDSTSVGSIMVSSRSL